MSEKFSLRNQEYMKRVLGGIFKIEKLQMLKIKFLYICIDKSKRLYNAIFAKMVKTDMFSLFDEQMYTCSTYVINHYSSSDIIPSYESYLLSAS